MKKTLSLIVIISILVFGLFILTGCENGGGSNKPENKNIENIEIAGNFGKLTFQMPKETGYELKVDTNKGTLTQKDNKSTIEFYLMNTSKSSIIMQEKDFSKSAYSDYKEIEINGHKAYTIKKSNNFAIQYGILMEEYDKEHNKNYGVKIVVSKNSLKLEEFDPSVFIESEAFKMILSTLKFEGATTENTTEANKNEMKNYGEFSTRNDGISDKDGLLFIKKYDSPKPEIYKAEQRNDNVGIDNYLWYTTENRKYNSSSIEVRIFPKSGTYTDIEEYKTKKGNMYTWSKTTIAGKEYDTYVFSTSTPDSKYSQYHNGAFMVGNKVVEFSYSMYAEIPDQDLGDTFFNQILNSIEYSKDFK